MVTILVIVVTCFFVFFTLMAVCYRLVLLYERALRKKEKKKMNDRKAVTNLNVSVNVLAFWCVFGDVEMKRKLNWVKVLADVYSVSIFCVLSVCRLYIKKMLFSKSNASKFMFWTFATVLHLSARSRKLILELFRQLSIELCISHLSNSSGIPKHLSFFQVMKIIVNRWGALF